MPTVPVYNRQISQAALPNVKVNDQAPIEAFGGGAGVERVERAFVGLMDTASNVYMQEKQNADQVNVLSAKKQLTQLETDLQYNKDYGYLNKGGKDASAAMQEVQDRWTKGISEITNGLSNEEQKFVFSNEADNRWGYLNKDLNRHAFQENKKFETEETKSFVDNEQNAAIANYQTPARVIESIKSQQQEIYNFGKRNGLPAEAIKSQMDEAASKTHYLIATQFLNEGDDQKAKQYFEENQDKIVGKDLIGLKKDLEIGILRGSAQRESDRIMDMGQDMRSSLAEARKIEEPKKRDETIRRVKERFGEREVEKRQAQETAFMSAAQIVDQTKDINKIPPSTWNQLEPNQWSTLRKLAAGNDIQTNWAEFYSLQQMAAEPKTRKAFKEMNLLEKRPDLAEPEFKALSSIQAALRKGDSSVHGELDGILSNGMIISSRLKQYGVNTSAKPGTEEANQYSEILRSINTQAAKYKRDKGAKDIPDDQLYSIIDNLMIEGVVPGTGVMGFFQTKKRLFELGPDDSVEITPDQVPRSERNKIIDSLRRNGLPETEENILNLFNKKAAGMISNAN